MSCEFSHYDGAYVLGALSPAERSAFEAHLVGCAECTRAVQGFAGLPGLLGRVPEDVLEPTGDEPLPETLLPSLVEEVRRTQRRRGWVASGAAAAAVVVIAAGSLAIGLAVEDQEPAVRATPTETAGPVGQAMTPIGPEVMTADLALTSVSWGTRLDLTCTYPPPPDDGMEHEYTYVMVVLTRDGKSEQVATWTSQPGETLQLTATTATSREEIGSVEIRTSGGDPLLTLSA